MANAAQPASTKTENGRTNFGGSVVDGNRIGMIGTSSWFQTQDVTDGTNLISPLNVTTGTVVPVVVPSNATRMTIISATNPVAVSEVSGTTSLSQYVLVPVNTAVAFPVARQQYVYLLGSGGTASVSFFFETV